MDKPVPNLHFKLMTLAFKIRDFFLPRRNILKEIGVKPGFHLLDFGCGSGSYILETVKLVGEKGKVYALDIHPLAIKAVQNISSRNQVSNIETILSDCRTGLPDDSIDVILLYDTFHDLSEPSKVLKELHRVLKLKGILSFSDHHMKKNEILSKVTQGKLFKLIRRGKRTYNFYKGIE